MTWMPHKTQGFLDKGLFVARDACGERGERGERGETEKQAGSLLYEQENEVYSKNAWSFFHESWRCSIVWYDILILVV